MDIIRIRCARRSDRDTIAEFQVKMALETEGETLDIDTVTKGISNVIEDPVKGSIFVAEIEDEARKKHAVGSMMITDEWSDWRNGWVWWIQSVYVLPEYRRKGVFSALYEHVKTLALSNDDIKGLRLYVDKRNTSACRVYETIGMDGGHYALFEAMKVE